MKRITKTLLSIFTLFSFAVTGCDNAKPDTHNVTESELSRELKRLYQESGSELTYEQWLATLRGKDGRSVVTILKTGSDGLVDTYTISYSDSTTSTFTVTNGANGERGISGVNGADGHTPVFTVGANGNWFVDGADTGIKAQGEPGTNGVSVVSIDKTSSEGLVDTYTITYSNNTTSTFIVTNGANGERGIEGEKGSDGHTPVIVVGNNGHWFVDGADTGISAQGPQGNPGNDGVSVVSIVLTGSEGLVDTYTISFSNGTSTSFTITNGANGNNGASGKSAYELYCDANPSYEGDLEQWLDDLINGCLAEKVYHTVTLKEYDSQETIGTIQVEHGYPMERPEDIEREGYRFDGWYYIDETTEFDWIFPIFPVVQDITLYCFLEEIPLVFWSGYGSIYSNILMQGLDYLQPSLSKQLRYQNMGSAPGLYHSMVQSIATGSYPNVVSGYANHFYQYMGSNILLPFEDYFSSNELNDYYADYLSSFSFYDRDGVKKQFGVPCSVSAEVMVYNGAFVDYCADPSGGNNPELANIPETWDEWAIKGPQYMSIYDDLINNQRIVFGVKDYENETVSDFSFEYSDGKELIFDFSRTFSYETLLMCWDSADNAFITLLEQWGIDYTKVDESENAKHPKRRIGDVLFTSNENIDNTVDMLKFVNSLHAQRIFGLPTDVRGNFSTEAFMQNRTMFSITSSANVNYLTNSTFVRLAPVPYKDADKKFVMFNENGLTMTNRGYAEDCATLIKGLTTGELQAQWCTQTGYLPVSKSAFNSSIYQSYLNQSSFEDKASKEVRDVALMVSNTYRNELNNWNLCLEPAFVSSQILREACSSILQQCLYNITDIENNSGYYIILNDFKTSPQIASDVNIRVVD